MARKKEKTGLNRALELTILGAVGGIAVACGGSATEALGGMMEDAGQVLVDAGDMLRDGGIAMLDDAGDALRDAGQRIEAGSTNMTTDANAQQACGTCTSSGAVRTILASEDAAQLEGGSLRGSAWTTSQQQVGPSSLAQLAFMHHAHLADGPLVVTDFQSFSGTLGMYIVKQGTPCFELVTLANGQPNYYQIPSTAHPLQPPASAVSVHGVRFIVRSGEALCASGGIAGQFGSNQIDEPASFVWSGFHPYQ